MEASFGPLVWRFGAVFFSCVPGTGYSFFLKSCRLEAGAQNHHEHLQFFGLFLMTDAPATTSMTKQQNFCTFHTTHNDVQDATFMHPQHHLSQILSVDQHFSKREWSVPRRNSSPSKVWWVRRLALRTTIGTSRISLFQVPVGSGWQLLALTSQP